MAGRTVKKNLEKRAKKREKDDFYSFSYEKRPEPSGFDRIKNSGAGYLIVVLVFAVGFFIGVNFQLFDTNTELGQVLSEAENRSSRVELSPDSVSSAKILLPAVDDSGRGVVTDLVVEITPGTGRVLTNIDKLLFWVDTQNSIQIAKEVAERVSGVNLGEHDIVYTINAGEALLVGGPSAGAALTVATIAALQKKPLNESVMITGSINPDGSIGRVGAIVEKAGAARDVGAKLFLVPGGEGTQTYVKPDEKCVEKPNFIYCETVYREVTISVGGDLGIDVAEVFNIEDAMNFFSVGT